MKYAFKMVAVVLALEVLVLQGCQTVTTIDTPLKNAEAYDDKTICSKATDSSFGTIVSTFLISVWSLLLFLLSLYGTKGDMNLLPLFFQNTC